MQNASRSNDAIKHSRRLPILQQTALLVHIRLAADSSIVKLYRDQHQLFVKKDQVGEWNTYHSAGAAGSLQLETLTVHDELSVTLGVNHDFIAC